MASAQVYLKFLKTGSALTYPVIMNTGIDWSMYVDSVTVKDDNELAIGDIIIIDANREADATGDESVVVCAIILPTTDNKAILEGHGLTVSKTVQFLDGDQIDILYLVPGMILSMKVVASDSALRIGSRVTSSGTAGQIKLLDVSASDEPASQIGYSLAINSNGTGVAYVPIMVTM